MGQPATDALATRTSFTQRDEGRQHRGVDAFGGTAPITRAAFARTLSSRALARAPAWCVLLGLPKSCSIARRAASAAAPSTGLVALLSR